MPAEQPKASLRIYMPPGGLRPKVTLGDGMPITKVNRIAIDWEYGQLPRATIEVFLPEADIEFLRGQVELVGKDG